MILIADSGWARAAASKSLPTSTGTDRYRLTARLIILFFSGKAHPAP